MRYALKQKRKKSKDKTIFGFHIIDSEKEMMSYFRNNIYEDMNYCLNKNLNDVVGFLNICINEMSLKDLSESATTKFNKLFPGKEYEVTSKGKTVTYRHVNDEFREVWTLKSFPDSYTLYELHKQEDGSEIMKRKEWSSFFKDMTKKKNPILTSEDLTYKMS